MDNASVFPALRRFGGTIINAVLTGSLGDTFDLERFQRDNPETMYRKKPKKRQGRNVEHRYVKPPPYRPFGEKALHVTLYPRKYVAIGIKSQADIDRWAEHIHKIVDYASGEPTVPEQQPDNAGFRLDPVLGYPLLFNIITRYKFPHYINLAKFNAEHLASCEYKPTKFSGCVCKILKHNDGTSVRLILFEIGTVQAVGARNNADFETINTVLATLEDYAAAPRGRDTTAVVEELDKEFENLTLDDDWTLSVGLNAQFENLTVEEKLHSFNQGTKTVLERLPPRGRNLIQTREKERVEWIEIVEARNKEQKADELYEQLVYH